MIGECLLHQFWSLSNYPPPRWQRNGVRGCRAMPRSPMREVLGEAACAFPMTTGHQRAAGRCPIPCVAGQPLCVLKWFIWHHCVRVCQNLWRPWSTCWNRGLFYKFNHGLMHCWNMLKSNSFLFVGPDRQPRPIRSAADGSVEVLCAQNTAPWTDRDKSLWSYGQVIGWKFCEKEERWCS